MKLKPVGHRVLIELEVVEEKTKGGIILGTADDRKAQQEGMEIGIVKALGPTAYNDFSGESWVKVGDRVHFKRYEGVHMEREGVHYRILNDEDVYATENLPKKKKK